MSTAAFARGGAAAGSLSGLPALDAEAVLCQRRWFPGPEARHRMQARLTAMLRDGEA